MEFAEVVEGGASPREEDSKNWSLLQVNSAETMNPTYFSIPGDF